MSQYVLVHYHMHSGYRVALVKRGGRKLLHFLTMDGKLTVRKVPLTEQRYIKPVAGKIRAMSHYVKVFRSYGRSHGMTRSAKSFLQSAAKAKLGEAI